MQRYANIGLMSSVKYIIPRIISQHITEKSKNRLHNSCVFLANALLLERLCPIKITQNMLKKL